MLRLRRLVVLAVLVAGLGVGPGITSSQAHTDACTGTGNMTTSTGLGLPALSVNTANFAITFPVVGRCLFKITLFMTGILTGACGLATGAGVTSNGHTFVFVWTTDEMQFSGEVQGTLYVREDPNDAGSCLNKTATNFIVAGTLVMTH